MASVQFFGKDSVLAAFVNRGLEVWAIFDGKIFMNAGEGSETLSQYLELLEPGGSQCVYTLKVYKNVDDADLVTDATPSNGAFKFKLTGAAGAVAGTRGGMVGGDPIMSKLYGVIQTEVLAAIEKKLNGGEEEKEETIGEIIKGYLREPERMTEILPVLGMIKNFFSPASVGIPVALAGITPPTAQQKQPPMDRTQEQLQRLSVALDRLEKKDDRIVDHLEKLADIADYKPLVWKLMLAQLDSQ